MAHPHPILFTIPNFITAGSGRAMLNIVERLDRRQFAPAICVARKGGDLDREVDALGIPFFEAPFTVPPRPYGTLMLRAWRASRAFAGLRNPENVNGRSGGFALWHSFHYSDDYTEAIIARMARAKGWIFTKKNMGWGSRAWRLRSRFATKIAAQNSDMMREFFSDRRFQSKVKQVPRGVNSSLFNPEATGDLGIRSERRIADDGVVAACVAQLVSVKGHPTLLEAIAPLSTLHLLIAGSPLDKAYSESLHERVAQLKLSERVHFLGSVKRVPALLAESDIFVLPTWGKWRMEGCPVALLEAMSCGKACVATDIPGSRDLVEHGKSGLLVPPEDPHALGAALKELASSPDLRRRLGRAARQRVVDHFSIEREVAAHETLYRETLGVN